MTALAPISQVEFDWNLGHARPWLKVWEVARALAVSENQVINLFNSAAIDAVIDIKADSGSRPCYRVLRESFARYTSGRGTPTDLSGCLAPYLANVPAAMGSHNVAIHLRCSEDLVLSHAAHFFDASAPGSTKTYFRASKSQLLAFVNKRRIQ